MMIYVLPLLLSVLQDHNLDCPAKCDSCKTAITKSLDYLASKQQSSGVIPIDANGYSGKEAGNIITSSLSTLAFMNDEEGKYEKVLKNLKNYLYDASINKIQTKEVNGNTWPAAFTVIAFCHILEKEIAAKKDKEQKRSRKALKTLVKFLVNQQTPKGGWSLGKTTIWTLGSKHMTASVNIVIIALSRAKSVGMKIDDSVFDKTKKYYSKAVYTRKDKTFFLYKPGYYTYKLIYGRTAGAILALKSMGEFDKNVKYAKAAKFLSKNIDKIFCHHVQQFHLMIGGYLYHNLGKEQWLNFVKMYYDKLLKRQRKDGSLKDCVDQDFQGIIPSWTDHSFGSTYATAVFALILQTPLQKTKFIVSK